MTIPSHVVNTATTPPRPRSRRWLIICFLGAVTAISSFWIAYSRTHIYVGTGAPHLAFSPDGSTLAAATWDGFRFWNVPSHVPLRSLATPVRTDDWHPSIVVWSPNGQWLATNGPQNRVHLWAGNDGTAVTTLAGHMTAILDLAFSADSTLLASADRAGVIKLWRIADGTIVQTFAAGRWVSMLAFEADGDTVLAITNHGVARWWRIRDGTVVRTQQLPLTGYRAIALAPKHQLLAVSNTRDNTIALISLQDSTILQTLRGHTESVTALAFSPDERLLASGSGPIDDSATPIDTTVRVWMVTDGGLIGSFEGHTNTILSVAFTPDSHALASAGIDPTIRIWALP